MTEIASSAVATLSLLPRYIEDIRDVSPVAGTAVDVDWLPDGRTMLVIRLTAQDRNADLHVLGPRTRAKFKSATGVSRVITITIKPGWSASLLGVAASTLTDRIVALEDLWGRSAADLSADLLAAQGTKAMADRFVHAISLRTEQTFEPSSARLARHAVRLLEGDEVRVESVAERLGVTARHLRRAFTESVGIGPKEFARTVRLRRAVRSAATSHDWARIATEAGYYDQAHLIADFQQLVGLTPGAYVRRASDRATLATLAGSCHNGA